MRSSRTRFVRIHIDKWAGNHDADIMAALFGENDGREGSGARDFFENLDEEYKDTVSDALRMNDHSEYYEGMYDVATSKDGGGNSTSYVEFCIDTHSSDEIVAILKGRWEKTVLSYQVPDYSNRVGNDYGTKACDICINKIQLIERLTSYEEVHVPTDS